MELKRICYLFLIPAQLIARYLRNTIIIML